MNNHLSATTLMRLLDGEHSMVEKRRWNKHMQRCWKCRVALKRLETDLDTILQGHEILERSQTALPPRQWDDLVIPPSRYSRIRDQLKLPVWTWTNPPNLAPGLFALAVVLCLSAFVLRGWWTPTQVSASEVIERLAKSPTKMAGSRSSAVFRQRVRLDVTSKKRPNSKTVVFDAWKHNDKFYWAPTDDSPDMRNLQHLYALNQIPLDLPLQNISAISWQKISSGSPVVRHNANDLELAFMGNTQEEHPEEVVLQIDPVSWQVRSLRLVFANVSYRLSEESFVSVPETDLSLVVKTNLGLDQGASTHREIASTVGEVSREKGDTAEETELKVYLALHAIAADRGEPIRVTRTGDAVEVNAASLDPQRQRTVANALAPLSGVRLIVESGGKLPSNSVPIALADSGLSMHDPDERIAKFFDDQDLQRQFTHHALQVSDSILAHAYLLDHLRHEFPQERRMFLTTESAQALVQLLHQEESKLAGDCETLDALFEPMRNRLLPAESLKEESSLERNMDGKAAESATAASELASAIAIDRLLKSLLTVNEHPSRPEEALPQLHRALRRLSVIHPNFTGKSVASFDY